MNCLICGKPIRDADLYCPTRRCRHEFELKVMIIRSKREYKEYNFWSQYTIDHLEISEGIYQSKDPLY